MEPSETLERLQRYESQNITYVDPLGGWPIVWQSARGVWVVDEQGRRYLDLTAAFGVAATGHANPKVVSAGRRQMSSLLHAMGDVHPHALKARLAEELVLLTYGRWCPVSEHTKSSTPGKVVFGTSGSEAVEMALKTAFLATGRPGIIAFEGAYHGLGYGALAGTHRDHFRGHFKDQLREFGRFVPYPRCGRCTCVGRSCADLKLIEERMDAAAAGHPIGAVLVEPIQARGGIRIPSLGFLPMLRHWCDQNGALLILDEIYIGFGRTGTWFATEQAAVIPDLICLGKALTGGFPLSACVGRTEVMDAWPPSRGEAIHTSTYLGHPVGCAMALAQISELRRLNCVETARQQGDRVENYWRKFPQKIGAFTLHPRNQGLMIGIEVTDELGQPASAVSLAAIKKLLERGFIFLPEGEWGEVISLTPPLTISWRQLKRALDAVLEVLVELIGSKDVELGRTKGISTS